MVSTSPEGGKYYINDGIYITCIDIGILKYQDIAVQGEAQRPEIKPIWALKGPGSLKDANTVWSMGARQRNPIRVSMT